MSNASSHAPRRTRTGALGLTVALLVGVLTLLAPPSPAGALSTTQVGGADCASVTSSFSHGSEALRACRDLVLSRLIEVNGVDVAAGTALKPGDVVRVYSTVPARTSGERSFYSETGDGLRNHPDDLDAELELDLPSQTGTLLSAPTNVVMTRADNLDRSGAGGCVAQAGAGDSYSDFPTNVTLDDGPVGNSQMLAWVTDGTFTARWKRLGHDRCSSDLLSNNGLSSGFVVRFDQTVLVRGATAQSLSWTFGGLQLQRDDEGGDDFGTVTWGGNQALALPLAAGAVPGAPTIGTAFNGNGQATVAWTAPASSGGAPITGYEITPYLGGTTAQTARRFTSTATSQVVTGLTAGSSYTFRVKAFSSIGTGAASAASNSVTPFSTAGAPSAPSWVPAQMSAGNRRVNLSWLNNPGGDPTQYRVTPRIGGIPQTPVFFTGPTRQTITQLTNATPYTFTIAAGNASGFSPESAESPVYTPIGWPVAPTNVVATRRSGTSAQLRLTVPASDGGSPITGYKVTPWYAGQTQVESVRTITGTEQPLVVTGLTPGRTYDFVVSATNALGDSPQSEYSNAVLIAGAPGPVTGLTVDESIDGIAAISWQPPADDGGSPLVETLVDVYRVTSEGSLVYLTTVHREAEYSYVFINAAFVNKERYRVYAHAANTVGLSEAATVEFVMLGPPSAPLDVTATAGNGQATVSWTAPANDGGFDIVGYYVVPYVGDVAQPTRSTTSNATTLVVTGLTNGTTYTFAVQAETGRPDAAASARSNAVTPTGAPVAGYAPFASWGALVDRVYVDLTTKAPTASERSSWVSQLTSGSKTKGDLVAALRAGTDGTGNVDPATRLYRAFLQRTPDAGGLKFWVGRRRGGSWNLNRTADYFANSSEFKTKYGTLSNRDFVTLIYTDVLGRTADTAGVNFWTGRLDRKKATRGGVMVGFSESSEYQTKTRADVDVAVAYIFLLGRAPTSSEASAWTTAQRGGTSAAALAKQLLDSPAYAAHIGS